MHKAELVLLLFNCMATSAVH